MWFAPAAIADTFDNVPVGTVTGVNERADVEPCPNWPSTFRPQHFTDPAANSAHVWLAPAAIARALLSELTATGLDALFVEPFPS
jgi:hypothetical protein